LESDDYDDRFENVEFRVTLPDNLDKSTYNMKILAYDEHNDLIGGYYKEIIVTPCASETFEQETVEEDNEEKTIPTESNNEGTVFLPTGFTVAGLDKNTWSTIFWILGDVVLVIVAIYFVTLIFRKRNN
jgi:hypothetical protein